MAIPKVVVIGGCCVETVLRCNQIPSAGETVVGTALSHQASGSGLIQAAQASLCGCRVHLVSKVGSDCLSHFITESLSEFDIDDRFIYTARAKHTSLAITMVNSEGDNANCLYNGASDSLSATDLLACESVIADADVCLIHGQVPQEAILTAINLSHLHSTRVIINPAGPIDKSATSGSLELPIAYFANNLLIPNLYEAAQITERSTANIRTAKLIGSDIIARGADSAVITMGRRGSMIVDRNDACHIDAFAIDLVDKAGTGDAFAGALAASIAVGDSLKTAVKFASAAAGLTCTKFGTIESLPQKTDIIELLQKEDQG